MFLPAWRKSRSSGSRPIIQAGLQAHSDLFFQTLHPLTALDVMDATNMGEPANGKQREMQWVGSYYQGLPCDYP